MALLENSPNTKEEAGITLTLKPEEKNYRPGPSGTEVQNTLQTSPEVHVQAPESLADHALGGLGR